MGSLRSLKYLAAVAAFAVTPAFAADLPPLVEPPIEPPILKDVSGWYIRGDIGAVIYKDPEVNYGRGAVHFENEELKKGLVVGGGVGYKFSRYLRGDITVDYRPEVDFHGNTRCPTTCAGGGNLTNESSTLSATTAFVSGYVDLGHYHGFSPYVGGGVGVAVLDLDDAVGFNSAGNPTRLPGSSDTNFAWHASAGFSYAFSESVHLDTSWRYVDFGSVETEVDTINNTVEFEDIHAHEVRVGLRYHLH